MKSSTTNHPPEILNALLSPCLSREHLDLWFRKFLGVQLSNNKVSRFATIDPLSLAWMIYSHAMRSPEEEPNPLKILVIGARGTQKTLTLAAINTVMLLHDRRSFLHYAASKSQANTGFSYVSKFLNNEYIKPFIQGKPSKELITLKIPNYKDPTDVREVTASVFPISTYSVESKHAAAVSVDELGSLTNDKAQAYRFIAGIPTPTLEGKQPIIIQISSRKNVGSLIEEQIAHAHETDLKVFQWTIFEMTKVCPPSRHGTEPMVYYGSPYFQTVVTENEYHQLEEKNKIKYVKTEAYKNCFAECPLGFSCLGDAAKQTCNVGVLSTIEKSIFDFKQEKSLFLAQRLSLEPTREGSIFSGFSVERHCKTEKEILELIKAPVGTTDLVSYLNKQKYLIAAGIDHSGGSAEGAITLAFVDELARIFWIDEYAKPGLETKDTILKLKEFDDKYKINIVFPDPASVDKNREIERTGFILNTDLRKQVIFGIDLIREYLIDTKGETKMFFLKGKTDKMVESYMKYRFKSKLDGVFSDEPAEAFSHYCDSSRYLVQNVSERQYIGVKLTIDEIGNNQIKDIGDIRRMMNNTFKQHMAKLGIENENDEEVFTAGTIRYII